MIETVQRVAPIVISPAQSVQMRELIADIDFELCGGYLSEAASVRARACVIEVLGREVAEDLVRRLHEVSASVPGYLRFRFGPQLQDLTEDALSRTLVAFCTLFGEPVRVFDRWPIWKPLGVSFEVAPHRATGVGFNPLHIDVVNSTAPPDYVAFFCDQVDPQGGGQTVVSNLLLAAARVSPATRAVLEQKRFREGAFYELTGVGAEYNPFPVIDMSEQPPRIRFTAKMLSDLDDPAERAAMDEFYAHLEAASDTFMLGTGDMIVCNQWVAAHGRLPLGEGQRDLPLARRRLIRQCFINRIRR